MLPVGVIVGIFFILCFPAAAFLTWVSERFVVGPHRKAVQDSRTLKYRSMYLQNRGFPELKPPATLGSAGYDLVLTNAHQTHWTFADENGDNLPAGATRMYGTGLKIAIPPGYVGLVRSRSSAFRRGLIVQGTIDSDYRGEVLVVITNVGPNPARIEYRKSVAQLILVPYLRAPVLEVDQLEDTDRGVGGFGSTGA